jgi:hypothetical protein
VVAGGMELAGRAPRFESVTGANPHSCHHGEMECCLCQKTHREYEDDCAQRHEFGCRVPWRTLWHLCTR